MEPAPEHNLKTTSKVFLSRHSEVIVAADFFTVEVWTRWGLARFLVLVLIDLSTRGVEIAGIATMADGIWMGQVAHNLCDEGDRRLRGERYLIDDRDPLFTTEFLGTLAANGVKSVKLPPRSPNLKAYASHCPSSARFDTSGATRWRSQSFPFRPCIFRGGSSPGCSYKRSFLSLYA